MKVLFVSPIPPPTGGIATWTKKILEHFQCCADNITVDVVNSAVAVSDDGLSRDSSFKGELARTKRIFTDFKKKLKSLKPDVVHINTSCSRFGIIRDALCMVFAKKIPIVLHCHCNISDQIAGRFLSKKIFSWMVKGASAVLTLNEESSNYVRNLKFKSEYRMPNYIESDYINDDATTAKEITKAVFVGHVIPTKGIFELLKSAESFPEIRFIVVGPVLGGVNVEEAPSNVQFMGNQSREAVQQILRDSDLFLFPTYTEGFSIALLEAMASGLPVITTSVGANSEMIEQHGGILVSVGSSEEIVAAIQNMRDENKRKSMSEWNVEKVKRCYVEDVVVERLKAVYENVMNG